MTGHLQAALNQFQFFMLLINLEIDGKESVQGKIGSFKVDPNSEEFFGLDKPQKGKKT